MAAFLRDNFNCSAGLAQWRGLAQTLERGWENLKKLCKPETKSRVCITVENSPNASCVYTSLCKLRKKVFYFFYKITFPRKRKTLCMALIKREILTSCKVLSLKSCPLISCCFAKRCSPKYGFFSLKMSA